MERKFPGKNFRQLEGRSYFPEILKSAVQFTSICTFSEIQTGIFIVERKAPLFSMKSFLKGQKIWTQFVSIGQSAGCYGYLTAQFFFVVRGGLTLET